MKATQREQAREFFFGTPQSQKDIAQAVGVSEKTVNRWIKQEEWDTMKKASLAAPAVIVDLLYSQVVEMQNNIASRDPGFRIPTMEEAEITRKLINNISKLGMGHSVNNQLQVMKSFAGFIEDDDSVFTNKFIDYFTYYLQQKNATGYKPYEFVYNARYPQADSEIVNSIKDEIGIATQRERYITYQRAFNKGWEPCLDGDEYEQPAETNAGEQEEYYHEPEQEMSATDLNAGTDISTDTSIETLTQQASQPNYEETDPGQNTDISGHFEEKKYVTVGEEKYEIPWPLADYWPEVPILPGGIKWIGRGRVYDIPNSVTRDILYGEVLELKALGFDKVKLRWGEDHLGW